MDTMVAEYSFVFWVAHMLSSQAEWSLSTKNRRTNALAVPISVDNYDIDCLAIPGYREAKILMCTLDSLGGGPCAVISAHLISHIRRRDKEWDAQSIFQQSPYLYNIAFL